MTIKIKAQKAWQCADELTLGKSQQFPEDKSVRIVRESDWRKLMKLVRAVEDFNGNPDALWDDVESALRVLRGKGA